MHTGPTISRLQLFQIVCLSFIVVLAGFVWQGTKGLNLSDEGFLWYGAQRVLVGEVPIRDFMSYDPGRYYWSAALMRLWGNDGIMALRGAVAVFQVIGLAAGLLLVADSVGKRHLLFLILSAVTLAVWMTPYYKLMDMSVSILLIGALTFLLRNPTGRRYFIAGLGVGLAAVFGRNHGLYGVVGSIGVLAWLNVRRGDTPRPVRGALLWAGGVVAGYLPILLMVLLVPGFAGAFWESIRYLLETRSTNIPLPVPWPWRVHFAATPPGEVLRQVLIGMFFIATVVGGLLSLAWVFRAKLRGRPAPPAVVAASCLALPYAHYAYARADVEHLALGIFPLLVGCLVLLNRQSAKLKWPLTLLLCFASLFVMLPEHPGWQCYVSKQWVVQEVSGSNLTVAPNTAHVIRLLHNLAEAYAPGDRNFVVTPFWPAAYSLLGRKSSMWEIYAIQPSSQESQQQEIDRINREDPGFIYILDTPLDGRDEFRFSKTHQLIYQYVVNNYHRHPDFLDQVNQLYIPRK